jgi:DNA polymerase III sliding clamp (beta) subunit (PCNA family)
MLIPPNILQGVSAAASRDTSRLQLCGVLLERGEDGQPMATATDGKTLMHARWVEDPPAEFPTVETCDPSPVPGSRALIPIEAVSSLAKMPPKKPAKPILRNLAMDEKTLNGSAVFAGTDLDSRERREVSTIEGTFPDYRPALAAPERSVKVSVNAEMLANILEAVVRAGELPKPYRRVTLEIPILENGDTASRPVLIHAETPGTKVTGLVMPLTK